MRTNNEKERYAFYCSMLEDIDPGEVYGWLDRHSPDFADALGDGEAPASIYTERLKHSRNCAIRKR